MVLAVFSNSLCNEKLENGSSRIVLKLPAILAPCKVAILPLLKKDGLPEIAKNLLEKLKTEYSVSYDEKDAIGRRYRRQDALGTPYCITIDHQSIEENTVTVSERDTMKQERMKVDLIEELLVKSLDIYNWLQ